MNVLVQEMKLEKELQKLREEHVPLQHELFQYENKEMNMRLEMSTEEGQVGGIMGGKYSFFTFPYRGSEGSFTTRVRTVIWYWISKALFVEL